MSLAFENLQAAFPAVLLPRPHLKLWLKLFMRLSSHSVGEEHEISALHLAMRYFHLWELVLYGHQVLLNC